MPRLNFEPWEGLFREDGPIPKGLLLEDAVKDIKQNQLTGVPDAKLHVSFDTAEGDDITITRMDDQQAQGYSVFKDEQEYFDHLSRELHQPTEAEVFGG